jgi:endonuclease/exonuclease/phosphatase family metal-dependent hydrolase
MRTGLGVTLAALSSSTVLAQDDVRDNLISMSNAVHTVLSVTTLNMAKEKNPERILKEWRAHPAIWNSDILLLQEVAHFDAGQPSVAQTLAKDMNRHVISSPSETKRDVDGLAIISRYPLTDLEVKSLDHNEMLFHTRHRIMIAATVQSPFGPVRVYNVHLDSRINKRARLKQIQPVISEAAKWRGPRLIGGDFNTNYLRWAGNVVPIGVSDQAGAIRKAMSAEGFTTAQIRCGPTSDFLKLRLDWVYARDIQVSDAAIEPLNFSDHHAVRVRLAPEVISPDRHTRHAEAGSALWR